MKKTTFLLAICMSVGIIKAQDATPVFKKNVLKISILPPLLSNTSEISYERFLKPTLSLSAVVGANLKADQSDFQLIENADLQFLNRDITNRYVIAEVRRYIDFCGCGSNPYSFYAGGFVRYRSVQYSSNPQFDENIVNLDTKINLELQAVNLGILLGYQINLNNWRLDFEFGGIGYGHNAFSFNSSSTLSTDELSALSGALNQNFGITRDFNEIELNSSSANIEFWTLSFRYAVSVGYAF